MADAVSLAAAFRLPPRQVIAWFEAKGYRITGDWWEMWQAAHARAFTVAQLARLDLLEEVRAGVRRIFREGMTEREFLRELEPILRKAGWWGRQTLEDGRSVQLGSAHRLRTIYRTNKRTAYNAGRWREQAQRAGGRPYWMYVAVMDSRVRPSHAALAGRVYRWDDPIWDSHYPPNGWGCRCRVRALSESALERLGLQVSDSAGQLRRIEQEVGVDKASGEVIKRPGTLWTDPVTGNALAPDPGWSYNPGRAVAEALDGELRERAARLGVGLPRYRAPRRGDGAGG